MIAALVTVRGGQTGFKDNALLPLLGRPILAYPYLAAAQARHVDRVFFSTDGPEIQDVGTNMGMEVVDRPHELSLRAVGHPEVIQHALSQITARYEQPEILVVMLGNVATHEVGIIDKCIALLRENAHVDSCVTVSQRNEYHPLRAKSVLGRHLRCTSRPEARFDEIVPYVEAEGKISTNRQDLEPVYFLNHAVWALRPECCLFTEGGQWPGAFMGETVVGIETDHGIDIRTIEDVAYSERWLTNHGWSMDNTPYWT
jgi:CMP-N,N'-diacetyllegionaminic acid synthase